jgi:hypothetical protein
MKKAYLILILFTFLISCSHKPKKPEHKEYFVTHILADGTKMFSFSIVFDRAGGRNAKGQKGAGQSKGGRGGDRSMGNGGNRGEKGNANRTDSKQKIKDRFYAKLEKVLFKKNYCRKGYRELNSFIDREEAEMKGQCNEKANKIERIKFVNQ